jgi:hypothetical protein
MYLGPNICLSFLGWRYKIYFIAQRKFQIFGNILPLAANVIKLFFFVAETLEK